MQLIDSFGPLLVKHLADEIETLLELEKYDIKAIKEAYIHFDLKMREGDKVFISHQGMRTGDIYRQYYFPPSSETVIPHSREGILGQDYLAF